MSIKKIKGIVIICFDILAIILNYIGHNAIFVGEDGNEEVTNLPTLIAIGDVLFGIAQGILLSMVWDN